MLKIANISSIVLHSFGGKMKIMFKIRVIKAIPAILEVVDRKATTGVGESE